MIIVVRGAGDIASGVIYKLYKAGFKVLALECETPSSIRRTVSFSEAIYKGSQIVENIKAVKVFSIEEIERCWKKFEIPVIIDENCNILKKIKIDVLVDSILAKRNLGTNRGMAPLTIGVGPGFCAGEDVDFVVETMRGHSLGRVIKSGEAIKNTAIPGVIAGVSKDRVIYSLNEGVFKSKKNIGEYVEVGEKIGDISGEGVKATITGVLRGVIPDGYIVKKGLKIADIDPRKEEKENCYYISDKAKAIGSGVLEIILEKIMEGNRKNGINYIGENN